MKYVVFNFMSFQNYVINKIVFNSTLVLFYDVLLNIKYNKLIINYLKSRIICKNRCRFYLRTTTHYWINLINNKISNNYTKIN